MGTENKPRYIDANCLEQFAMPIKDHTGKIEKVVQYEHIINAPAADVQEVKHGRIVKTGRRYSYCSVCDTNLEGTHFRFCPYCGVKFDEENSND